jgi:hypothetical protein
VKHSTEESPKDILKEGSTQEIVRTLLSTLLQECANVKFKDKQLECLRRSTVSMEEETSENGAASIISTDTTDHYIQMKDKLDPPPLRNVRLKTLNKRFMGGDTCIFCWGESLESPILNVIIS